MHTNFSKLLTTTMVAVAVVLTIDPASLLAQSQAGQTSSPSSNTRNTKESINPNIGSRTNTSKSSMDNLFVKKATESNIAEVEISKMAVEKASSEKVKEFAQMMVEHHTAAQLELYSIFSKSTVSSQNSSSPNSMSNDANDETSIESTNNDADKTATLGGTGGTTGSSMAMGKTNGEYNSNKNSVDSSSKNSEENSSNVSAITNSDNQRQVDSINDNYITTELSEEHKLVKNKLSILTGAEFDHEYIQTMVKDHAIAVKLFEKQALQSKDAALQAFASKMLPKIKDHYQQAQQLNNKNYSNNFK